MLNLSKTHFELGQIIEIWPGSKCVLDKFHKCKPKNNHEDDCRPLIDTYKFVVNTQYLYLKKYKVHSKPGRPGGLGEQASQGGQTSQGREGGQTGQGGQGYQASQGGQAGQGREGGQASQEGHRGQTHQGQECQASKRGQAGQGG